MDFRIYKKRGCRGKNWLPQNSSSRVEGWKEATMTDAGMSARSRREHIRTQRARYLRSTRAEKGRILDEGCRMFGMERTENRAV